ncbi:hypothetical protein [Parafrankia sp. BMG5.11]|uniref:hypothetical protein n=1 Tax=Parafrankia sp. BMG5.11 TaxID=222540 RepID=UPI0035A11F5D
MDDGSVRSNPAFVDSNARAARGSAAPQAVKRTREFDRCKAFPVAKEYLFAICVENCIGNFPPITKPGRGASAIKPSGKEGVCRSQDRARSDCFSEW